MKKLVSLLVGENQNNKTAILMLVPPICFLVYILLSYPISFKSVATAILSLDIFAGLLSNLQDKTNQAWKKQTRKSLIMFVIFHLTVYPLVVILLQVSIPLMILMLGMLFTKTMAFAFGTGLFIKNK